MSRSLKKGPYVDASLLKKVLKAKETKSHKPIKTWARDSSITPEMVGLTFQVHNGKNFIDVFAEENMVGHKLGEFSLTRKFTVHGGKMAKDQAKAAPASGPGAAKPAPTTVAPAAKAK